MREEQRAQAEKQAQEAAQASFRATQSAVTASSSSSSSSSYASPLVAYYRSLAALSLPSALASYYTGLADALCANAASSAPTQPETLPKSQQPNVLASESRSTASAHSVPGLASSFAAVSFVWYYLALRAHKDEPIAEPAEKKMRTEAARERQAPAPDQPALVSSVPSAKEPTVAASGTHAHNAAYPQAAYTDYYLALRGPDINRVDTHMPAEAKTALVLATPAPATAAAATSAPSKPSSLAASSSSSPAAAVSHLAAYYAGLAHTNALPASLRDYYCRLAASLAPLSTPAASQAAPAAASVAVSPAVTALRSLLAKEFASYFASAVDASKLVARTPADEAILEEACVLIEDQQVGTYPSICDFLSLRARELSRFAPVSFALRNLLLRTALSRKVAAAEPVPAASSSASMDTPRATSRPAVPSAAQPATASTYPVNTHTFPLAAYTDYYLALAQETDTHAPQPLAKPNARAPTHTAAETTTSLSVVTTSAPIQRSEPASMATAVPSPASATQPAPPLGASPLAQYYTSLAGMHLPDSLVNYYRNVAHALGAAASVTSAQPSAASTMSVGSSAAGVAQPLPATTRSVAAPTAAVTQPPQASSLARYYASLAAQHLPETLASYYGNLASVLGVTATQTATATAQPAHVAAADARVALPQVGAKADPVQVYSSAYSPAAYTHYYHLLPASQPVVPEARQVVTAESSATSDTVTRAPTEGTVGKQEVQRFAPVVKEETAAPSVAVTSSAFPLSAYSHYYVALPELRLPERAPSAPVTSEPTEKAAVPSTPKPEEVKAPQPVATVPATAPASAATGKKEEEVQAPASPATQRSEEATPPLSPATPGKAADTSAVPPSPASARKEGGKSLPSPGASPKGSPKGGRKKKGGRKRH